MQTRRIRNNLAANFNESSKKNIQHIQFDLHKYFKVKGCSYIERFNMSFVAVITEMIRASPLSV